MHIGVTCNCFCKTFRLWNSSTKSKYRACATKAIVLWGGESFFWNIFWRACGLNFWWAPNILLWNFIQGTFDGHSILNWWWARKFCTQYTSLFSREPFFYPWQCQQDCMVTYYITFQYSMHFFDVSKHVQFI